MKNTKVIKIQGHYYLKIDNNLAKKIINEKWQFIESTNHISIRSPRKSIDEYWEIAANDQKRELFMNTVRPLLKEKLSFSYSEIICEEKAKLLCREFYEADEKGQKYTGPYLL